MLRVTKAAMGKSPQLDLTTDLPPEEGGLPEGDTMGSEGARNPPWDPDLAERLRVLLHARPLLALRHGDARRQDEQLQHYDSAALALKAIDLILSHTGLGREMDYERLLRHLTPLMEAMDQEADLPSDPGRHQKMYDRLLDSLRGADASRNPFEIEYTAVDDDGEGLTRRTMQMHLLREEYQDEGTVFRLSDEATTLYLRSLGQDISDAQVASEALIQHQLEDGRFGEAVRSARNARHQSARFYRKIDDLLQITRQDLRRVDWAESVPELLDSARRHARNRQAVESQIVESAEQHLTHLDPGGDDYEHVVEIRDLIRDCRKRHRRLYERVMDAPDVFLEEQARQAFRPRSSEPTPELGPEVLEPLLGMPKTDAIEATEQGAHAVLGPAPPTLPTLGNLLGWLLQPRQHQQRGTAELDDPDLVAIPDPPPRYPPAVRQTVRALLQDLQEPRPLSQVLEAVWSNPDHEPAVAEYLVQVCVADFAPDWNEEDDRSVRTLSSVIVRKRDGQRLDVGPFYGEDLLLIPESLVNEDNT